MQNERNYRIDLLRFISMMLIVVQHYVFWGIKPSEFSTFQVSSLYDLFDYVSMEALYMLSCIGVNCFIMITGYFMINRYEYRWKSLISLWVVTAFYSVALYSLSVCLGLDFNKSDLIGSFFPLWSDQYWFITKYVGLMLLAPFLSILAITISQSSYRVLLVIMFGMGFMVPYGNIYGGGKSIMWMAFVYLVAGYVRLYGVNKIVQQYALPISLGILALLSIGIAGVDIMRHTDFHRLIGQYQLHGFASDSPVFFLSLAIFVWTVTRKSVATTSCLSLFSRIAPYILAVYLIHMNKYFYVYVWNVVMPESYSMPVAIHALLWCTLITVICIVIDYARSKVFKMIGIDYVINTISASIKCKSIKTKYQQT